jgi:hypothetical protein
MTLKQWSDNGWLRPHKATTEEMENLFQIVNRDLKDARSGVSPDWRFNHDKSLQSSHFTDLSIYRKIFFLEFFLKD